MKNHIVPEPIKAGDSCVKLNGNPPLADCRVIAEDEYQLLLGAYETLKAIQYINRMNDET
ncbi:hypothetical protein LCGC14_1990100 [marine sediment metagenome]|uniref:Uncharacterized protein n=1 Tax=marine sediment metagenome TaxID=412755 RepID=A0A0F9F658_9ZZZZ